jgi:UDP-glucose 4-epimerase
VVITPADPGATVLVTGGAGFIGSHTCVALHEAGHDVVVLDDFSNSTPAALSGVAAITGRRPVLHRGDITDRVTLARVFGEHHVDVVVHFAAKKAVGESMHIPATYFDINVGGTARLLRVMLEHDVTRLVFSSSCSLYGDGPTGPLRETRPAAPTNPYAWSKWLCEKLIEQTCQQHPALHAVSLRYFNPIGAHPSGLIGEDPPGAPHNVMPYMLRVADGRLPHVDVFGGDYPTRDGTAVRDYVHVVDVAGGHRTALEHLDDTAGMQVFNLGTGVGTTVLELRAAMIRASGAEIPYTVRDRRPGDVAELVADPGKVGAEWGWRSTRTLDDMCRDAWNSQRQP